MNPIILAGAALGAAAGFFISKESEKEKKGLQSEKESGNHKKEAASKKSAEPHKSDENVNPPE